MPTFATPEPITLTLELGVGDLRIVASDRGDTVVEVEPSDPAKPSNVTAAQRTTVEYANGALYIKAPRGWKHYGMRGGESIDLRIELPTGSHLRGDVGVISLRSAGTLGDCRYKTGAGDITVEQVMGATELITATGAIRVDRIGGSATVKNGNGDIWIGEAVGDLQLKAANGSISVDHARAAVTAKTANGDVRLDEVVSGAIVAETACGNVDIAVRSGITAWLDLHTGFGRVCNVLDASDRPGAGDQTVEVRARSSFGDISIRRAETGERGQGAA